MPQLLVLRSWKSLLFRVTSQTSAFVHHTDLCGSKCVFWMDGALPSWCDPAVCIFFLLFVASINTLSISIMHPISLKPCALCLLA